MALNKYSSSRRFTNTTTGDETEGNGDKVVNIPEVTVSGRKKLTAEQRNDIAYKEYQDKQEARKKLVKEEDRLDAQNKADQEAFDKEYSRGYLTDEENKEAKEMDSKNFKNFEDVPSLWGKGGSQEIGKEALDKYNEYQRSGRDEFNFRPVAQKMFRPKYFESDDQFVNTFMDGPKSSVFRAQVDRPSTRSRRKIEEIDYPKIEESLDRMDVNPAKLTSRRKRVGDIDISDNRTKYVDPDAPDGAKYIKGGKSSLKGDTAKIKRKQNRAQFFENLITPGPGLGKNKQEGTAGRFKNMGERRRYRQEEDEAKATYGRGFQGLDTETLDERKEEAKYDRRRALATGNIRAAMDSGKEIRDARKAERYSARQFGNNADKAKYFTKDVMKDYRSSEDNPLNRNTTFGRRI